jgi:hypothetical protein
MFDQVNYFLFNFISENFFFDFNFILQFIFVYLLYNLYTSTAMYYTVFYLLLQTVVSGLMLMYYNMDLFSAFLFLAEFVIIFISILLVFYLNVYGNSSRTSTLFSLKKKFFLLTPALLNTINAVYSEFDLSTAFFLNSSSHYDNYYLHLFLKNFNDFYGLFINFFQTNSIPTVVIAMLLLLGSFIAVNIHIQTKSVKTLKYSDFFLTFDLFLDFSKFIFMRKQNLVDQMSVSSSTRFFKKKFE